MRKLIDEGNIRRVVVKQQGKTVAEFPLTAGHRHRDRAGRGGDWRADRPAGRLHDRGREDRRRAESTPGP